MSDSLLFWILNSDKKPQYLNAAKNVESGDGVTKTDGSPAHLKSSPDGWQDTLVKWARNNKYLGLFRDFSVPLRFVNDGGKILRSAMWNIGMEAIYYISISKLNRAVFPDTYEQWYTGEFDFSKFKQTKTAVEIQVVEGGLSKYLKAYESTTFEVPVNTDPNRFSVYLDGLTFKNTISSEIFDQEIGGLGTIPGADHWALGTGIVSNEGTTQGIVSNDQAQVPNQLSTSDNAFFKSFTKATTVNISGTIRVGHDVFADVEGTLNGISIQKYDLVGTLLVDHVIFPAHTFQKGEALGLEYSFSIPVEPGTMLTLYGMPADGAVFQIKGTLNYNYLVRFDPTLCEAMSWMNLFERLTDKLSEGKYGARSNFLPTLKDQCVTCGEAVRKYRPEAPIVQNIKTTMADFFQACRRWGVGLGIEKNTLIIEPYEYFFQSGTAMLHLGEVTDVEFNVAEDLVFNTIKVGYPNQTYDNVNGKDEFNVTQQYTTPHTRIVRELDLVCPYRADMFGIELTRLRLFEKDTTDNSADNDTFIMNVVKGTDYDLYRGAFSTVIDGSNYYIKVPNTEVLFVPGQKIFFSEGTFTIESITYLIAGFSYVHVLEALPAGDYLEAISTHDDEIYKLNRPAFTAITGLINPAEAFNVLLSPKHSFLNNAAFIHSVLDKQDAKKIVFQSGEKNSFLSTTLDGVTVTENSDVNIADLPAKLFLPYYAKLKTKVPITLPQLMRTNPYSKLSFDYKANTYTQFIWDAGSAPATNDAQEWLLLMAPENDMTKLI